MRKVYIVSAARTPIGSFMGSLSKFPAAKLGGMAIRAAVERAGIPKDSIDEVFVGCVLPAGQGQAPARQAALAAGLPNRTPCTTINKVCGSGLKTVMLGAQAIAAGDADCIVAGGMESMSNAPFALPKARSGYRLGNGELVDLMVNDGLWDIYNNIHMGNCGEICAKEMNISREEQDAFARESYEKAIAAQKAGKFKGEIAAVEIPQQKGDPVVFDADEEPGMVKFDKIPALRPVFDKQGTITAANASSINDGAAAVVLVSEDKLKEWKLKPMAQVGAQAMAAQAPEWFTTAPAKAINNVLEKAGLKLADIDLFEINEAFSVVSIANERELKLSRDKVNVHGGAVALGHPIGASGTRVLVTLLYAMQDRNAKRGIASLCLGGGEAVALIVERSA